MRWRSVQTTPCSIARSLSVVGERWTLLILREAFQGVTKFDHFRNRLGLARNVLTARLQHLVAEGVLDKVLYQDRPRRYEYRLTAKGRDLYPVLLALMSWGDRWLAGGEPPPLALTHRGCGQTVEPVVSCPDCGEPLDPDNTRARLSASTLARAR